MKNVTSLWMSPSINFSRMFKIAFKLQRCKFTRGKTREGCALISNRPPPKTCVHPLSALHSSHQIKFLLRSALVLYLQNVLLEQHKHVTMRTHSEEFHTEWNQPLGQIICISAFSASHGWARAYQQSVLSLCLFFTNVGFSWKNRPLHMCKLRSRFGGISPDQGGLKLSELDKWAREWPRLTVPGWPHTELWQARRGWQEARTVVGSSQIDRMAAQAQKTLSTRLEAVQFIAKRTSDWQPRY